MAHIPKKREKLFMDEQKHLVYILQCGDKTLYTGYTNDLSRRLQMHETGKGAKYTRGRGPFQVVYVNYFPTKSEAMQHEYYVKQLSRDEKLRLIAKKERED